MTDVKKLFIDIGLRVPQKAVWGTFRNGLNLIKSSLVATLRTSVVAAFFGAIRAGLQTISNFKQKITEITKEMAQLNLATIKTASIASQGGSGFRDAFNQAASAARGMSTQMSFTALEIQEGLYTATQAALSLTDSLKVTASALQLAQANGEQFQKTLNDLIGVSRAFELPAASIQQMSDVLQAAAINSKSTVSGLFEGLKPAAAVAATAFGSSKKSFIDTTAALMVLNDAGIESSSAGNKLRASMIKLMGGTHKSMAAFTKYGVNLFKANAESQKFLNTLLKGQKAFAQYDDKINKLKNRQFELAMAGRTTSKEYQKIEDDLASATTALGELEQGLDNVYDNFQLTGGQLKPFSKILNDIEKKAPSEVIGRAFGIRGGEPMMRLLKDIDKYNKFVRILEEVNRESEKGKSILQAVFGTFLESVVIKFARIKNTLMAIFSVIADAAFEAFGPLLDPIDMGLKSLYSTIEENKDIFKETFQGVAALLAPLTAQLGVVFQSLATQFKNIFTPGSELRVPITSLNSETGGLETTEVSSSGTTGEKISLAMRSVSSAFNAVIGKVFKDTGFIFKEIAPIFAESLTIALKAQTQIFISLGGLIASGFYKGFKEIVASEWPNLMKSLKENMPGLAKIFGVGEKRTGPTEFLKNVFFGGGGDSPSSAIPVAGTVNRVPTLEDLRARGKAIFMEQSTGVNTPVEEPKSAPSPHGFMTVNGVTSRIDFEALNQAAKSVDNSGKNLVKTVDLMESSFIKLDKYALEARRRAEQMERRRLEGDLKVK